MNLQLKEFSFHALESDLVSLRYRLEQTRFPDQASDSSWQFGMPIDYAKELRTYWLTSYDWRKYENQLNHLPNFTCQIDGHPLHFIHLKTTQPNANTIVLLNGWPSSIFDFFELADLLTNSDTLAETFNVVIPTIPGFGFSKPTSNWDTERAANAFVKLMVVLGYNEYYVHGEDFGAKMARDMAQLTKAVKGIHVTTILGGFVSAENINKNQLDERIAYQKILAYAEKNSYAALHSTQPESLAYALNDSPLGLFAWISQRYVDWSAAKEQPDEFFTKDQLITTVMVYWLNQTISSSIRYYSNGRNNWQADNRISVTPTAVLVMPDDLSYPIRRLAEKTDNIVHWTISPKGGHFASLENPTIVAKDIRDSFAYANKGEQDGFNN